MFISTPINKLQMHIFHVKYGKNFHSKGMIKFLNYSNANGICIGDNVNINSSLGANPVWSAHETVLFTKQRRHIRIGDNVGISNAYICSENLIDIRDCVTIGAGVKIYDTDFHPLNPLDRQKGTINTATDPVLICNNSFIGAGALILKGVTIGENAIIGAGAVVTKSVPSNEVWGGNPARFIRKL